MYAIYDEIGAEYAAAQAGDRLVRDAIAYLKNKLLNDSPKMSSPAATRDYLTLVLADKPHEEFYAVWLTSANQVIDIEKLFTGTISGASVHPREVVRAAIRVNAAAVIFAHNHPSGSTTASTADRAITLQLKEALSTIDIRVLDHLIVGHTEISSFAEKGLL